MKTVRHVTVATNKSGEKIFVQKDSLPVSEDALTKKIEKTNNPSPTSKGVIGSRSTLKSEIINNKVVDSVASLNKNVSKETAQRRLNSIDPYSSEAVELASIIDEHDTTTLHDRDLFSYAEVADTGGFGDLSNSNDGGGFSGGMPSTTSVTDVVTRGMLVNVIDDIIYDKNPFRTNVALTRILRDMFYHDSTTGAAVNLFSTLPFSDFSLSGIKDEKMLQIYVDSLENMKINSLLPNMSIDYLVVGTAIVSLAYDNSAKTFMGSFPHNVDFAHFIQVPSYGIDPIIRIRIEPHIITALKSPEMENYKKYIPKQIVDYYSQTNSNSRSGGDGFILDPKTSLFIARNATLRDFRGTSLLKRAVPAWLYEKALIKGTMDQSYKRQRPILHVTMGEEEWVPVAEEMQFVSNLFLSADLDPLGAIVVTRRGVETNEIRRGDDFWRWDQNFDAIERIKLRALGISESFVSGDACLSGDTLVPTDQGIMRIDSLLPKIKRDNQFHPLSVKIGSRYGNEQTSGWLYNGVKKLYEIVTDTGRKLKPTGNHQILVVKKNLKQEWIRTDELEVGDVLCTTTKKIVRTEPLPIALPKVPLFGNNVAVSSLHKPKFMTPDFAWLIGAILAEGSFRGTTVYIPNNDVKFLDKCADIYQSLFGLQTTRRLVSPEGTPYNINGNTGFTNADHYVLTASSKILTEWLKYLGLNTGVCKNHRIPWSILQADQECQIAFAAAYLEGDGSFGRKSKKKNVKPNLTAGGGAAWISYSDKILDDFMVMFNSWGLVSEKRATKVFIRSPEFKTIYPRFEKYLVSKKFDYSKRVYKARTTYGIPIQWVKQYLLKRKIKTDRYGTHYLNDNGEVVIVQSFNLKGDLQFQYDCYDNGKYDKFLEGLKLVSRTLYNRLTALIEMKYDLTKIVSIKKIGKNHVYDISMGNKEPAFVANGLVVHNSYNSLEQTISVFMDQIRSYRNQFTTEIFYEKIFPMISQSNNITKQRYGMKKTKEVSSYGPRSRMFYDDDYNLMASINGYGSPETAIGAAVSADYGFDPQKYLVPELIWHKRLMPEADDAYINMLGTLSEKGLPITSRFLASAGGINFDSLMEDLESDIKDKDRIFKWRKEINDLMKQNGLAPVEDQNDGNSPYGGGGGGDSDNSPFGEFASTTPKTTTQLANAIADIISRQELGIGSVRRKPVLAYGDKDHPSSQFTDYDSQGNRRVLTKQGRDLIENRFHKRLAEAAAENARKQNRITKNEEWERSRDSSKPKFYFGNINKGNK